LSFEGGIGAQDVYWAIKTLNFDLKAAREKLFIQPCKLDELRLEAYENSRIYNERTNKWHDKHIMNKRFEETDMVVLFNSNLKLFLGKLRSRSLGPFQATRSSLQPKPYFWANLLKVISTPFLNRFPIEGKDQALGLKGVLIRSQPMICNFVNFKVCRVYLFNKGRNSFPMPSTVCGRSLFCTSYVEMGYPARRRSA